MVTKVNFDDRIYFIKKNLVKLNRYQLDEIIKLILLRITGLDPDVVSFKWDDDYDSRKEIPVIDIDGKKSEKVNK